MDQIFKNSFGIFQVNLSLPSFGGLCNCKICLGPLQPGAGADLEVIGEFLRGDQILFEQIIECRFS